MSSISNQTQFSSHKTFLMIWFEMIRNNMSFKAGITILMFEKYLRNSKKFFTCENTGKRLLKFKGNGYLVISTTEFLHTCRARAVKMKYVVATNYTKFTKFKVQTINKCLRSKHK